MNIVWQSALPPTLCAICVFVFYIIFSTRPQVSAHDFCPYGGLYWRVVLPIALTTRLPFLGSVGGLVPSYTVNDWEALRPFPPLHDVRRLVIVYLPVAHVIF